MPLSFPIFLLYVGVEYEGDWLISIEASLELAKAAPQKLKEKAEKEDFPSYIGDYRRIVRVEDFGPESKREEVYHEGMEY